MLDDPNITGSAAPDSTQAAAPSAPAPAPVPAVTPQQPAPTPPPVATSKNPALHNLIGSVLGGLAGHPPPSYSYSPDGKLVITAAPPQSSADKIRRIASSALTGLAAGGGPEKKSGLANILAGAGAGAQAVEDKAKGQDVLKRAQAKEEFEQEQQTKLRGFETARLNALTYTTHLENEKRQNDLNPEYAQNESLYQAAKASPELSPHVREISGEQALREIEKDKNLHTHIFLPMGKIPVTDDSGNPVRTDLSDPSSPPKMTMRYAVIDSTKDGQVAITPGIAADIKRYAPLNPRISSAMGVNAGDTYDIKQLVPLLGAIAEAKKTELEGWQKSTIGEATDPKSGKSTGYVEINSLLPPGDPNRTRPLTAKPISLLTEEGKTDLEKAQAREADAKAKEALANAAAIAANLPTNGGAMLPAYMDAISKLPQTSQAILRNVSPGVQMSLLKVANGDQDVKTFPVRTTKGSGQLDAGHASNLAVLLNPNWNEQMYKNKQGVIDKLSKDPSIASFNQLLVHLDTARNISDNLKRTNSPALNAPLNEIRNKWMGEPGVPELMTAIATARSEWETLIKSGHAPTKDEVSLGDTLMSDKSNVGQILGVARIMGETGLGRLDQIDSQYRRSYGGHYPGLISSSGRRAAINLGLGDTVKQYPEEATFGNAQPQNQPLPPQDAGAEVYAADGTTLIGHVVNNKYVPLPK
jgi:hypothetical protein